MYVSYTCMLLYIYLLYFYVCLAYTQYSSVAQYCCDTVLYFIGWRRLSILFLIFFDIIFNLCCDYNYAYAQRKDAKAVTTTINFATTKVIPCDFPPVEFELLLPDPSDPELIVESAVQLPFESKPHRQSFGPFVLLASQNNCSPLKQCG